DFCLLKRKRLVPLKRDEPFKIVYIIHTYVAILQSSSPKHSMPPLIVCNFYFHFSANLLKKKEFSKYFLEIKKPPRRIRGSILNQKPKQLLQIRHSHFYIYASNYSL